MKEVKEFLKNNQDIKYAELNKKLNIATHIKSYGVRLPIIRNFAKTLAKKYSLEYLIDNIDEVYYEEILLKGFLIAGCRDLTFDELVGYLDYYLPKISDWSICDSFASSLKITSKYLDELWLYILEKTHSKKEFEVRFALVLLLNYYINDNYQNKIYEVILSIKSDDYYVKMANAWIISYMFIFYFDETLTFVKNSKFDKWTICKGITKTIESRKITDDNKKLLKELRKKINNR